MTVWTMIVSDLATCTCLLPEKNPLQNWTSLYVIISFQAPMNSFAISWSHHSSRYLLRFDFESIADSLSFAVVKPAGCFREPLFLFLLPVFPARRWRRISGSAQPLPHSEEEEKDFGLLIASNVAASGYAYKPSSSGCELRKFNPALVSSGCWIRTWGCKRVH